MNLEPNLESSSNYQQCENQGWFQFSSIIDPHYLIMVPFGFRNVIQFQFQIQNLTETTLNDQIHLGNRPKLWKGCGIAIAFRNK
jgi:hypothetical protein